MKKVVLLLAVFIFSISFTSCKSTKGGCGLTSDAAPIHKLCVSKNHFTLNLKHLSNEENYSFNNHHIKC